MRRFTAVALREITERRFVLVAAAVAAVIPLLVPFLPGVPGDQAPVARMVAALTLSLAFGVGGGLLVGASVVGRELGERRLSFHFSRPLPGAVVWAGKLLGGLALVLLSELIVILPSVVIDGTFLWLPGLLLDGRYVVALLLLAVPLFLLAWVGSVALRSRSPWLVVDLVLVVSLPALLYALILRYGKYGLGPGPSGVEIALGVLVGALFVATLAQVVAGRTDPRRGHGAQALSLWGILFAATAVSALWAERMIDPGVERLYRVSAAPVDGGGNWVLVGGSRLERGGGEATYLADLSLGRAILLRSGSDHVVSADGSRAAYIGVAPHLPMKPSFSVETIDLKNGGTASMDLGEWADGLALSADGHRLGVISGQLCSIYEVPSFRALASARIPSSRWAYEAHFITPEVVRILPRQSWRDYRRSSSQASARLENPVVLELDVRKKTVARLATYDLSTIPVASPSAGPVSSDPVFFLLPNRDASRVLVQGSAYAVRLLDSSSGRVLASSDGSREAGRPTAAFLADGRVVLVEPVPGGRRLALLSPDGARLSTIPLPAGTARCVIGSEPAIGRLAVGVSKDWTADTFDWLLVDIETSRLRPLGVKEPPWPHWFASSAFPPPGSPATRLGYDADKRLVLYDPATGATKPITRGVPAAK